MMDNILNNSLSSTLNSNRAATYLLSHGFGFDNDYWGNFIKVFNENSDLIRESSPKQVLYYEFLDENFELDEQKEYIGIGHSLGFLKLNNLKIQNPKMNLKALVGLQGFLNFCSTDPVKREIRQKNLDKMIKIFSKDHISALNFFREACGYPSKECGLIASCISRDELISDLELMKKAFEHCSVPTLIIGSLEDNIVERSVLLDNFGRRFVGVKENEKENDGGKMASLIYLDFVRGVNHTLGFSKSREVFEMIQSFLERIYAGGKC